METKKSIKISLKVLIAFIIIVAIIIISFAFILNKNNNEADENSTDAFTFEFLKMENDKKNIIYSPLSIKYALKMIEEGANGNTRAQIQNVIGNLELTKYNNIDKVLSLANGIYIKNNFANNVKEEFKNRLIEKYNAEVQYDDFSSANNINGWIEDKTFGMIENMVNDELLEPLVMLLINTLAIDMEWEEKFDDYDRLSFDLINGNSRIVDMLVKETQSNDVSYYQNRDITVLTMDLKEYDNTKLEFMAIMPSNDLSSYIEKFTEAELNKISNKLTLASETKNGLRIYIPKFSFDYELNLKDDLKKLGITDMFSTADANLSNITDTSICVSEALHKATIEFNQDGINAPVVTGFRIKTSIGIIIKAKKVIIDRPFMFLIRDKNTGEIWFTGALYEPNRV